MSNPFDGIIVPLDFERKMRCSISDERPALTIINTDEGRMEVSMFVRNLTVLSCFCLSVIACGEIEDPSGDSFYYDDVKTVESMAESFALVDGTPEAVGVLAFVNDEATSFRMLDIDAKLDRRAARGIIHHRNGPDGVYGTWDDAPFKSIEEVDAIKWVGRASIARLIEHATLEGWVPETDQLLGVYDGVAFTVLEADLCVQFVNASSEATLDVFLNRRAARELAANAPYVSIQEIASVRYVGRSAMGRLKASAVPTFGKDAR